jgi:DNA-binding response OmpR family regulator
MSRILVIEDDATLRSTMERSLTGSGHVVSSAPTGIGGLEAVLTTSPQVVLLDLGLPDVDGITVIGMIRAASTVPVIVVTASGDDCTMVKALDAGADDCVVKPFGMAQVAARIRAVLRRGRRGLDGPIAIGTLTINARTRAASLDGEPLDLARKEFDLLLALAQRPGEVVSKQELLAEVWQQAYGGSDRTVDVHLSWLRRKLGETAAEPRFLQSVRGVGVRLVEPGDGAVRPRNGTHRG